MWMGGVVWDFLFVYLVVGASRADSSPVIAWNIVVIDGIIATIL